MHIIHSINVIRLLLMTSVQPVLVGQGRKVAASTRRSAAHNYTLREYPEPEPDEIS